MLDPIDEVKKWENRFPVGSHLKYKSCHSITAVVLGYKYTLFYSYVKLHIVSNYSNKIETWLCWNLHEWQLDFVENLLHFPKVK